MNIMNRGGVMKKIILASLFLLSGFNGCKVNKKIEIVELKFNNRIQILEDYIYEDKMYLFENYESFYNHFNNEEFYMINKEIKEEIENFNLNYFFDIYDLIYLLKKLNYTDYVKSNCYIDNSQLIINFIIYSQSEEGTYYPTMMKDYMYFGKIEKEQIKNIDDIFYNISYLNYFMEE